MTRRNFISYTRKQYFLLSRVPKIIRECLRNDEENFQLKQIFRFIEKNINLQKILSISYVILEKDLTDHIAYVSELIFSAVMT